MNGLPDGLPTSTSAESLPGNTNGIGHLHSEEAANEIPASLPSLSVVPDEQIYDGLHNGHLSPSEDSGTGMSDHGSQSSQSPNQSFIPAPNNMPQSTTFLPPHHHHHIHQKLLVQTGCNPANGDSASPNMPVFHPSSGVVLGESSHSHGQSSASPASFSPTTSRGESPIDANGGSATPQQMPQQQHIVLVHVSHGETFSVRLGEEIQHIAGKS